MNCGSNHPKTSVSAAITSTGSSKRRLNDLAHT
jgi:hypothetical protein